ncbi:MAG: tRNA dihydrouridine synthase DusB [Clostridia bacterium]|nr:tRNA dihydrouridine synthase DusB [Clostridia bacterium]
MFETRLAPMCGITDHIFRTLCYEQGCDLAYTEMISAMGYLCAPEQRATKELMIRGKQEPRLILQLFGREPNIVAEAAKRISELGIYDGIDLNMGCPAKKIAPSGEGCGLMRTPETACRMMEKTVKVSFVPVSIKMRTGYDKEHINVIQFAKMAEDAGISSITVHGRTREQQYSGEADWDMIAEVKRSVHIPVCGNGDIFTAEDALDKQNKSKTDSVMIGRGAMGNPWIFREIRELQAGREKTVTSRAELREMIFRHYHLMLETKPEHIAVREMRKHIGWYIRGIKGSARFRAEINRCPDAGTAMDLIRDFFDDAASEEGKT